MGAYLPTGSFAEWRVADFRDSLIRELARDRDGRRLRFFMYAVTLSGWEQVCDAVATWQRRRPGRAVDVYVGTDHGLTDADALTQMRRDGVDVHLMIRYIGTFHPKVVWLSGGAEDKVWVGSNNLTQDALIWNVEFASITKFRGGNRSLSAWFRRVHEGSTEATDELIEGYSREKLSHERRAARIGTFTWSERRRPRLPRARRRIRRHRAERLAAILDPIRRGDLVVEIMPRETGSAGNQVQLPTRVAIEFFGLPNRVGASREIRLSNVHSGLSRDLTLTMFENHTTRLSLRELEYRHRPCVVVFRAGGRGFVYEIVPQSVFPQRYADYFARCGRPTRRGSRRWGIIARPTRGRR